MSRGRTHYETLGVQPEASVEEIRAAYRRIARGAHPDVVRDADPATLAAANAAWHVLGDRQRREAYDRQISAGSPAHPPANPQQPASAEPPPRLRFDPLARYRSPPRFPWRLMAAMTAIGVGLVLVGQLFSGEPQQRPVDNLLTPGSCVTLAVNGDAVEVRCDEPHDGVVARLVAFEETCPPAERGHRDRQGMGIACLTP